MDDARRDFEEALKIYTDLAKTNPDRFGKDVALVQALLKELGSKTNK
jgi:hypothetical protein